MLNRQDDIASRLARFSSVEARAAGMEEDLSAVLADISQLHSQLLAAEHANTDLMSRHSSDPSPRIADLNEVIARLEHQLRASATSMEARPAQFETLHAWHISRCLPARRNCHELHMRTVPTMHMQSKRNMPTHNLAHHVQAGHSTCMQDNDSPK